MTWKCPKCGKEFKKTNQDHYCLKPETIDEYINAQEEAARIKLEHLRSIIHEAIPEAEEKISWSMPTFWKGKNIIHFAASKHHIGLYPGDEAVEFFSKELIDYDTSKGTIRMPWESDLPVELIKKISKWCYEKYTKE